MSDLEFDKLIAEGLIQSQAETAFRRRLKQQSGQALTKGHKRRLWYRRTGLMCVVLLVAISAFWSGRITTKPQSLMGSTAIINARRNHGTVLVARELVTWLDAARFFQQLGMEERADKAFQLASTLAPAMEHQPQMAEQKTETRFVSTVHKENTLSSLLARYDTCVRARQKTIVKPSSVYERKHVPIIAQSIGGKNHDH